ncbi:MAG: 6-phosphofructokinase [Planctomycetia bacterium]|nr:6-phosphofructokinase [Planctomycetia bacterium]
MTVQNERIALLVGGGPAPGLNGVISAVTIEAIEQGFNVIGFMDGFKWLVEGSTDHYVPLTIDAVKGINLRGGSILRTSRTNPTKKAEAMANVLGVLDRLNVTRLVTIGGDDTAYSGSQVYKQAGGKIRVAHVPKTIDNDLPLPGSTPTFGFETARQVGVGIARNLAEDAKTASRWYLVVSMGRAAGHLALGIGKAAASTLTIISEEFGDRKVTIDEVCDIIIGSIIKRRSRGNHYGIAVLAEGLLESIGEVALEELMSKQPGRYGDIVKDDHGHLRLGEVEFGRMIKDLLDVRLKELGLNITLTDKDLGYELRCADPIPFDAEYTRDLGFGAVEFLMSEESTKYGAIVSVVGGELLPLPFEKMLDPQTRRMKTRQVNVDGVGYKCARRYMIRLEKRDFRDPERLAKLAREVKMTSEQFKDRFGKLVQNDPWSR